MDNKKYTVLIVDDDPLWLEFMSDFVALFKDLKAQRASSGEEALKIIRTQSIDLIVADSQINWMNAKDLLKAIKKDHPSIPILLFYHGLIGHPLKKEDIKQLGADYVIRKSEALKILPDIIRKRFQREYEE